MRIRFTIIVFSLVLCCSVQVNAQTDSTVLEQNFFHPPKAASPWVFWYWMQGAVSREGITADLEAMKEVGIAGAYLMPIKDTTSPPLFQPAARQLSPLWWELICFAMQEAKRLDIRIAIHVSDGFALAGGPWITPELSMQKLVWTKSYFTGGKKINQRLAKPPANLGYYEDVAVLAYPVKAKDIFANLNAIPKITTSRGSDANFLANRNNEKESFKSDSTAWIQYAYVHPFTCRSVQVHVGGNNYQAQRLIIQSSDDGKRFKLVTRLEPPRHGWQDTDEDVTSAIPATTAKYFRFVYDKNGSEPGSEDLDAAKWKPSLKVMGIYLSGEPVINQYESKNGSIWRVSKATTTEQLPTGDAIPLKSVIDLTSKMDKDGNLNWTPPAGNWVVVRIGHTTTGQTNATGGGGKGLECDKFNTSAIQLQFDNWFKKIYDQCVPASVLKIFHVDSWECGSQNWSKTFPVEFKKRRGYDLHLYLLAMTGVPIQNAATSEKFLHDVRETIAELVNDIFYTTLKKLAHEKGCEFSAESVAPTMMSDGLLHYKTVDLPMGEFWLNSPTHDKPNDMSDAISGAHIYGKNIIQAESFTTLRMDWSEHPGSLKTLGDRNFALGMNKVVLHVFTQNPWMNRKPGMTLDGVGLYFQRDQTWFKQSRAWIDYLSRVSAVLQIGKPVVDIAVFTGEEVPRRSILPDRLVGSLPGIFGKEKIRKENIRLANAGEPMRVKPDGVTNSANIADPEDWIDPLNGYAYDSFNPDVLLQAEVKNGRVVFPGGMSYAVLVFPGKHPMHPESTMSLAVAKKILQLIKQGAKIIMDRTSQQAIGLKDNNDSLQTVMKQIAANGTAKKNLITIPYGDSSFEKLGLQKDVEIANNDHSIAWTHRKTADADIYFLSNQSNTSRSLRIGFRVTGKLPEIWNPVNAAIATTELWEIRNDRTWLWLLHMEANSSRFIVFRKKVSITKGDEQFSEELATGYTLVPFTLQFDPAYGGPATPQKLVQFESWTNSADSSIRYYSGTAKYSTNFELKDYEARSQARLKFDSVCNIATVFVNGVDCGTIWTKPYEVEISKALKAGNNQVEIHVTNTWRNRLIGDQFLPVEKRITWTTAPLRLAGKPLLPSGLIGKVNLEIVWK